MKYDLIQKLYDGLEAFHVKYNKNFKSVNRERLNLIYTPSMFWSDSSDFSVRIETLKLKYSFDISTFNFTKIEIKLFLKYTGSPIALMAQKNLELFEKCSFYNEFLFFKSVNDIIRIEDLDVPICVITCNINEAINITQLAVKSNVYICVDIIGKNFLNKNELETSIDFLKVIKKITIPYDNKFMNFKVYSKKTSNIKKGSKIIIDNEVYTIGENINFLDEFYGGEALFFQRDKENNEIVKILKDLSESKAEKIKILCSKNINNRILSSFCSLPKLIVFSENREIIGFTMERINGKRLDRFFYELSKKSNIETTYIIRIFLKIALAVRSVHLSGFIVGDLYLSNFIVTDNEEIKIVDCDSFQIINYPCDGFHLEAVEYMGKYLSWNDDFNFLKYMFDEIISYFKNNNSIRDEYNFIFKEYHKYINDVTGLIYAFYFYLHSKEELI